MTPRRLIEPARLAGAALLHSQSDERLVDLTRAGNGRAFEAIVTRYRRQLLRHCAGILPPERAEDAVQQAFLNAYKAIVAGEAELKLRPWLYRIAHNSALNLLRQNGWNHDQIPEDFDGVMQPPQAVEQSERIRQVVRNVQELPERQRDAIVLRELEGRSYDEIAVALGVSDGAVRQLLNRARTTLRAAATAITPPQLVQRIAEQASLDTSPATRIAEISAAGAGGAMTLAKFGTVVVVAGAVAGGMAGGPLDHPHRARGGGDDVAQAAEAAVREAGLGGPALGGSAGALAPHERGHRRDSSVGRAVGSEAKREHRRHGSGFELGDDRGGASDGGEGGGGGPGGDFIGDDGGEHSGPGGGEHSGSGDDGGGRGDGGGDHSGSGSGDGGSSSSGSGSSGGDGGGSSGSDSGTDSGSSSGSGSGSDGGVDDGSSSSGSGSSGSGDSGSSDGVIEDLGSSSSGPGSGLPGED